MDSIYKKLFEQFKDQETLKLRTEQSLLWFKNIIDKNLKKSNIKVQIESFLKNKKDPIMKGDIITFNYSAKHQATLPYYDKFPLVLVLKGVENGFLGLNFHYLPHKLRLIFLTRLYQYQKAIIKNQKIVINITYEDLVGKDKFIYYKPCLKMYKKSHIKKFIYRLTPDEWDMAIFLPTEKFTNVSTKDVWGDSSKKIK